MSELKLLNKEWRMQYLYRIKDKSKNLIMFQKNKVQSHLDKNKHTRNIILKSRQLGVTTLETIDMLDDTLFVPNFDALLIANDLETAKDIFTNKVELAWKNLLPEIRNLYLLDASNTRQLRFILGEGGESSIAVDASGRAQTYSRVHITEFAQVCARYPLKAKEILEGTIPAIPKSGRVDIESTAEGEGGSFHDIFWESWERGEPIHPEQFKAHFYSWLWDADVITTP